jgi:TolB-like protein/Flp pilus assembly protein TadD
MLTSYATMQHLKLGMLDMAEGTSEARATGSRSRSPEVFISYASPDSAVADAVCAALERSGVSCWVAPRNVMPGEFYADAIVRAIDAATVTVLVLSKNSATSSHVLREVERASSKRHPVVSLRIDMAPLPAGLEYFLNTSQWLDASGGAPDSALPTLVTAVRRIVDGAPAQGDAGATSAAPLEPRDPARQPTTPRRRGYLTMASLAAVVLIGAAVAVGMRFLGSGPGRGGAAVEPAPLASAGSPPAPAAFSPPTHSVAVLPFLNMSGDPKQDYFSDGLSEELLNSLTSIRDLHVAARTSSFMFKGKEMDLSDIAHKLNVGAVLEGSVRKDGSHVRITAQLINALTGFHLWSQTYDRDLKDVLKLQSEIATAVTTALQATLLADAATTIELGGTQKTAAFDAYLRGKKSERDAPSRNTLLASIAALDEAIRLDPGFAKAYAGKAKLESFFADYYGRGAEVREHFVQARSAARRALELAPELGEAHSAYAWVLEDGYLDFGGALAEHERALALSPNDSDVLLRAGRFLVDIGRADEGIALARRGASLDQLNPRAYRSLNATLDGSHHYREAAEAAARALSLNPSDRRPAAMRGLSLLQLGELEAARQSCDTPPLDWQNRMCLAIAYDKLHRRSEAEAQVAAMKADLGDASAYQYAEIYAQWGDTVKALEWLETAYRLKDPGIGSIKIDEFLDPLRQEPRFQEIERQLKIPN